MQPDWLVDSLLSAMYFSIFFMATIKKLLPQITGSIETTVTDFLNLADDINVEKL